jgi:perosamine synthetase
LLLIEDSAEAIGAMQNGRKTGGWGIGCFSFYPTKNISTGEGGMFTTTDQALAAKVRTIAGHGVGSTTYAREKKKRPWLRAATYAGFNFRMSSIAAALGRAQLRRLDAMNAARRRIAAAYGARLDREVFDLPVERPGFFHVWQMYTIKLKHADRSAFLARLRTQGIGATVHFDPPVHTQPYYAALLRGKRLDLPVTDRLAACIVTLPIYPQMTEADVNYVVEAANRAARECTP